VSPLARFSPLRSAGPMGGLARGLAGGVVRDEEIGGFGLGVNPGCGGCWCTIVILVDYLYLMRCS